MTTLLGGVAFLLRLAARADRTRLVKASILMVVGYSATPLLALVLRWFATAAIQSRRDALTWLALTLAVLLVFELMMEHFAHLSYFELGELVELALYDELVDVANGSPRIDRFDSVEFADGLTIVREDLNKTRSALTAVLQLGGITLQALLTALILITLSPWLVLLPLAAAVPVLLSRRAQGILDRAQERTAEQTRLGRHLLELATTGAAVKELRLFGAQRQILARQRGAWDGVTSALWRAQLRAAAVRAAGQVVFALGYGAAIVIVARQGLHGTAQLGDAILVIALAVQVSVQVASALGLLTTLQGTGRTVERLRALRDPAPNPSASSPPEQPVIVAQRTVVRQSQDRSAVTAPATLQVGIELDGVGFAYPGTDRPVLSDVSLRLPAGSSVAIVGENGAGKSTLVKLLCGLYQPTSGRILVDGADLDRLDPAAWRLRVATLFQDFARIQLRLRDNVGVGAVDQLDDDEAVRAALLRADAQRIVDTVPGGLDGLLGHAYGDGVELSGGQWQTLGLARAAMRPAPLLLILDEPAAALDAAAEHAIFERYAASQVSAAASGGITLFVSHRFSTVRMADLIVVLGEGRVVEAGSHAQLMSQDGPYAQLFALQARAYA